jgi:hypothetical protein
MLLGGMSRKQYNGTQLLNEVIVPDLANFDKLTWTR